MKVVIVGGVAGGATAAARIRRLSEYSEIVIYEKTNYVSYANCGLPYYIGGSIKDRKNLTLATVKSFWDRYRVKVNVNSEVVDIDSENKTVYVKDLLTGEIYSDSYDKLLLSPGAKAIKLKFLEGRSNVFSLRNVEDAFKIKDYIESNSVKKALIIGGGFVGVEMAENLVELGIDVAIATIDNQLLNTVDYDIASFIHNHIRSKGVKLFFNTDTSKIDLDYDLILISIGVKPDNTLALKANIPLDSYGAIIVNEHQETSVKDIYAVGDVISVKNIVSGEVKPITLAGIANKEARVAADNICGIDSSFSGSLSSSVIKVFDLTVASTGINESMCKDLNIRYEKVFLSPANHATYYPNASILSLKVIYDKDTLNILGAQAVGYDGVDKRIDVIATAIFAKLKATKLKDLDLVYAPPYSSAKDPVNMAGFIIDNIESGLVKQFSYDDIEFIKNLDDAILLDTRTEYEYSLGHASGFINIPLDLLRDSLDKLDKNKKVFVMCHSGMRSYLATRILTENGYDAYNFIGGYKLYQSITHSLNI